MASLPLVVRPVAAHRQLQRPAALAGVGWGGELTAGGGEGAVGRGEVLAADAHGGGRGVEPGLAVEPQRVRPGVGELQLEVGR